MVPPMVIGLSVGVLLVLILVIIARPRPTRRLAGVPRRTRSGILGLVLFGLFFGGGGTLVFGSELKALREHPAVSGELDLDAIGLYLESQYIPAPKTVYRQVHKLQAGHALMVEKGALSTWRYWQPDYSDKLQLDEAEALERLEAELRRSVKSMLVSDVPLGSFLSGGVDSSVVSALMVDVSGRPIDTFTLGFEGETAVSEHAHAQQVSRHIGSTRR